MQQDYLDAASLNWCVTARHAACCISVVNVRGRTRQLFTGCTSSKSASGSGGDGVAIQCYRLYGEQSVYKWSIVYVRETTSIS